MYALLAHTNTQRLESDRILSPTQCRQRTPSLFSQLAAANPTTSDRRAAARLNAGAICWQWVHLRTTAIEWDGLDESGGIWGLQNTNRIAIAHRKTYERVIGTYHGA